tara:strand:- start:13846 stop:14727 length:882 start_codon:yes stop_codon:yes gene_type:complete
MKNNQVKKILVTGGSGFVGKHLVKNLNDLGHIVTSLDKCELLHEDRIHGVDYIKSHTKDIFQLDIECDIVYHLGEYARISTSFEDVEEVWESNVQGTYEVVKFCRKNKAKLIYAASSSKFGNNGEDENLSPYAWTKAKNVELIKNYSSWFDMDYSIAYFYNVYGPGHASEGKYSTVIGIFENQLKQKNPLTVVRPGNQKRYFTHVHDVTKGLLSLVQGGNKLEFSFGDDRSKHSIEEVAKMFGGEIKYIQKKEGDRFESPIDLTNSKDILDWYPNIQLKDYINQYRKELDDNC